MLTGQCDSGRIPGLEFGSHYDCAIVGYETSLAAMKDMGKETINENMLAVKFECRPVTIIIPKKKPV
tara:strand:- start:598 stop:798 length:201 start_codon:yes stop_codon:yes gene_type:complete